MKSIALILILLTGISLSGSLEKTSPLGPPGLALTYRYIEKDILPSSVIREFEICLGNSQIIEDVPYQWIHFNASKENMESFKVWILAPNYPGPAVGKAKKKIKRYILEATHSQAVEYKHDQLSEVVLPETGAWPHLLPRDRNEDNPFKRPSQSVNLLGLPYQLSGKEEERRISLPENIRQINLTPDMLIGVPHNTRQKDETRRYDESDYELIPLVEKDYLEMMEAGLTCFRVDNQQVKWIENKNVYYWGIGGKDIVYPECLYKSNYLGPALFFDEPMVRTRDYVVRPKLKESPALRKTLTPAKVLEDFEALYHETKYEEGPTNLIRGLKAREDVDTGHMDFLQQNMYTWETMVSSAIYQLSEGKSQPPNAMVFEPPGRFGTRRILPELNMCFDCQIPVDNPGYLADMIFSFLRGAARITGKNWGTSIYGAFDRRDTFWFLTHAYDLGASRFFYWDSYQLACVPYHEYLAMTRHLRAHARNNPVRNIVKLKESAEVAILIPPGYNLGHVYMGRGGLWAIPELHVDRKNIHGITYRQIMNNYYTEVERCLRLGIAFDSFWHLEDLDLAGYREIVDIRENGKVEIRREGESVLLAKGRIPERPQGEPPGLSLEVSTTKKSDGYELTARARVVEGSAPVFYTQGANKNGVYNNIYVLWELFGPEEEDYYYPWTESWQIKVNENVDYAEAHIILPLKKQGKYRLRAATSDLAGRSTVVWKEVNVAD